jgi:O-succinylbenzoic acid--CoA ligase
MAGSRKKYAVPKTVAFTDELPRTGSGTVDRDAVRERLLDAQSD